MSYAQKTWWQRNKYKLNGILLILPFWYLYQSMNPSFPSMWPEQKIGDFTLAPLPLDMSPPYSHHGVYVKDFMLIFKQGDVKNIRQAYINIGPEKTPFKQLQEDENGILHGSIHGQYAHALSPKNYAKDDRAWITIETWQGEVLVGSWELPQEFINQ